VARKPGLRTGLCAQTRFLLFALCLFAAPPSARASVALLLHEPIGLSNEMDGAGHAAVYLSHVCTDDGLTVRLCRPGEEGVVVSTYPRFMPGVPAYWMAIPLTGYLYGADAAALAPMYGSKAVLETVRERYGHDHPAIFGRGFGADGKPAGWWPSIIGVTLQRTVYAFEIETSPADDARAVAALNGIQNTRVFDVTYNNCSDFSRFVINAIFPGAVRREFNDVTFTTPKGLARTLTAYAQAHPQMGFHVLRFPQISGAMPRSEPNRQFAEKMLMSRKWFAFTTYLLPISTAIMVTLQGAAGPFDAEAEFERSASVPVARAGAVPDGRSDVAAGMRASALPAGAVAPAWRAYQGDFSKMADEAVHRGLFKDRGALHRFADDVQSVSVPEYGEDGALRLRVGADGVARTIVLTRDGITSPASDPRLSYELLLSLIARDLSASRPHQPSLDDMAIRWSLLERLHEDARVWVAASSQLSCAPGSTCAAPKRSPWWKRAILKITH